MEHKKEECELCVFEEKCSTYQKREEVFCLFFTDNDFSNIGEIPESFDFLEDSVYGDVFFEWSEMSWKQDIYGVRTGTILRCGDKVFDFDEEEDFEE